MKIYEWIDEAGIGVVSGWRLQHAQRAKLDAKLEMLVKAEVDRNTRQANLPSGLLVGPGFDGQPFIYKLKARGNVQLRPMICLGPFNENEWTVLYPSVERANRLIPPNAADLAEGRRKQVLADQRRRRLLIDDED